VRQLPIRREALDRSHIGALDLAHRDQARVNDGAVDQDRARATLALAAALLGAGEAEVLAERIEEAPHPRDGELDRRAVDREAVGEVTHGRS
jgi:hypothetical protein